MKAITKEQIAEMKREGLDLLIQFIKKNPSATTSEIVRHYSKERGVPFLIPHPILLGVAREMAEREMVN